MSIFTTSITNYFKASKDIIKNLLSKPNTVLYPYEHVPIPEGFRGAPDIIDPLKCLLCMKCVRTCPTHALSIKDLNESNAIFEINLGRCCYCRECEDSCTFSAMKLTYDLNTSGFSKQNLIKSITIPKQVKKKKES